MISAEQLRQFDYCPRKIYWRDIAKLPFSLPYLTKKGGEFHESKEKRNYQFSSGLKTRYEVYLESSKLNLKGKADFIIEHENSIETGEFKSSLPEPIPKGYILQLGAIAMIAEEMYQKPAHTLVFKSKDGTIERIPFTDAIRDEVIKTRDQISELFQSGLPPSKTAQKSRCNYCEFQKSCF